MQKEIYIIGSAPEYTDNKVVRRKLFKAYFTSFIFVLLGIAVGVMSYLKVQADKVAAYERQVRIETENKLSDEIDLRKRTETKLSEETDLRIKTESSLEQETKKRIKFENLTAMQLESIDELTRELQNAKELLELKSKP